MKAARAESEAETRERIVDAMIALHQELGPARTSVSAIAERAGVQRLTVYRHFSGEDEMFTACSTKWFTQNTPPDPAVCETARDLLVALYRYYRTSGAMLDRVLADRPLLPGMDKHIAPYFEYLEAVIARLERTCGGRSAQRTATIRHAVQLSTWQSLTAITGSDEKAALLALRWCEAL